MKTGITNKSLKNDILVYWSIFAICGTFLTQDSSTELLLTKDPTIIITVGWCKPLRKVLLFPKQTGRSNTYKDILLFLKQSSFLSNCENLWERFNSKVICMKSWCHLCLSPKIKEPSKMNLEF